MSNSDSEEWSVDISAAKKKRKTPSKSMKGSAPSSKKHKTSAAAVDIPDKYILTRLKANAEAKKLFVTGKERRIDRLLKRESAGQAHTSVPKELKMLSGLPVKKKKTAAKTRTLLSFPGTFDLLSADGKAPVGTLARLDTHTPCMYFDFPEGRARLNGHRQYIEQNITALGCEAGKGMIVVDQYDSMIMFSELVWVGTKEANPDEDPLPFPKSIFGKGKLQHGGSGGEAASASKSASTSTSAASALKASAEEHAGPGSADEDEAAPSRKSGRASASVRKVYAEVNSDAEVIDGSSSDEEDRSHSVWAQKSSSSASKPKPKPAAKKATPNTKKPEKKKRKVISDESDDDGSGSGSDSDIQDVTASQPTSSQRSKRRGAASVSYKEDSDNDDAGNDGDSDDIGPGIWSPNSKKSTPSSSSKSSGTKAAKPLVASSLMFDD